MMSNRILIIGDSLTAGMPGVPYIPELQKLITGKEFVAQGHGGDTIRSILSRAPALLRRFNPTVLVIQGGANDLVLPYVRDRNSEWHDAVARLARRGSEPAQTPDLFRSALENGLNSLVNSVARIVLVTITCIGEDAASNLNRLRVSFNHQITDLAKDRDLALADPAGAFDTVLPKNSQASQYLLEDFNDLRGVPPGRSPDSVSQSRGLMLTIDGIHLNSEGAKLYAETLAQVLKRT